MNEQFSGSSPKGGGLYEEWNKLTNHELNDSEDDSVQEQSAKMGEKKFSIGEVIGEKLDLKKLVDYFDTNAEILHKSRYHKEGFKTHCLLVIDNILSQYEAGNVSEQAVVAACLHDIVKPRTAALNKRNEACFYGHEKVTKEELVEFLDPEYPEFDNVLDLIHGHMLPHGIGESTPEPFRGRNQEQLDNLLKRHDEQFKKDLMIISECDDHASVKSDNDLGQAEERASLIRDRLLQAAK